jgi:hypothetical protein
MKKTIYNFIIIILFSLSACVQGMPIAPSLSPSSGIEGHITEGPMCPGPAQIGNNTCPDQPYQATITILDANTNLITQFQTDVSGYFKIDLAPGTYILHPKSDKVLPHAADQSVVVNAGQFTQVTIIYDTGMR